MSVPIPRGLFPLKRPVQTSKDGQRAFWIVNRYEFPLTGPGQTPVVGRYRLVPQGTGSFPELYNAVLTPGDPDANIARLGKNQRLEILIEPPTGDATDRCVHLTWLPYPNR